MQSENDNPNECSDLVKVEQERYARKMQKRFETLLQFLPDPILAYDLNNKLQYVNPGFERMFGWTIDELKSGSIEFVPHDRREETIQGAKELFKNKRVHNHKTQRYTKDGRLLDIIIDGAVFYDENNIPEGYVVSLRDVTRSNRLARTNQILFKISQSLHRVQRLDDLLASINEEIQNLLDIEGSFVLLLDEKREEFYFFSALHDDSETEKKIKEIRFPADQGVSGRVYQSGNFLIVDDVSKCSFFLRRVDDESGMKTRNILSVPIQLSDRSIGVVNVVNKLSGKFDNTDAELLSTIASTIALPIENTRINEELRKSYEELKTLNSAKDRVIHHLSHELKTPIAVLTTTLKLLDKQLKKSGITDEFVKRILERGKRNLDRLLEIQYETEDLLIRKNYQIHHILSRMLEACRDEIEVLFENRTEGQELFKSIGRSIDKLLGPRKIVSRTIQLRRYIKDMLSNLAPEFNRRKIDVITRLDHGGSVYLPSEILDILLDGLIRNAIEHTPDHGKIEINLTGTEDTPLLEIKDYGVGFTPEKKHLLFENYFTPPDIDQYATREPYDFNAGGKGFDLLRMKLFSEQYRFKIWLKSERCRFIPRDEDQCPGDIKICVFCSDISDCLNSGFSSVFLKFPHHGLVEESKQGPKAVRSP
ncbi:sensor histidine kinase [Desulfococcus multivorans]|uniref:sensor histidine kinase n=1 Tax=Desulfococcus multivorans TaxID=897 RepID=UPI001F44B86D|nr:PAS domain S-box protein [Desulfococcus multivorans]